MRFIVMPLTLLIAACATPGGDLATPTGLSPELEDALDAAAEDAAPADAYRRTLVVEMIQPPAWGGTGIWRVTGANANEQVFIPYSKTGTGPGPCPSQLGGQCLDLLAPASLLTTVTADANGEALVEVPLPASGPAGAEISLQAAVVRGVGGSQSVLSASRSDLIVAQDDFVHFPAAVDVLFVVDNSCSMSDEQADLTAAFPTLLDSLFDIGLDFHVGVVSTDMDDPNHSGILREVNGDKWIGASDPNPEQTFTTMASLGTTGSAIEKGLDATYDALETLQFTDNLGFRRIDAQLAVVAMSDEDDQSSGTVNQFISWIETEVQRPSDLTFNSIVGPSNGCATAIVPGDAYYDVTNAVGGVFHSICDTDYSIPMAELADLFWTSVPYELSVLPDETTIVVTASEFGGETYVLGAADWAYDPVENMVRFTSSYRPPAGTDITVSYEPL